MGIEGFGQTYEIGGAIVEMLAQFGDVAEVLVIERRECTEIPKGPGEFGSDGCRRRPDRRRR